MLGFTPFCRKREASGSSSRQRAAYIRDRTLHCLCCFILLTQLRRQPTLALSTEAHGLQRDPAGSALAGASDKASRCAIGDGVKTVIRDKARARRAGPHRSGGDIQSCNMSRACRNGKQGPCTPQKCPYLERRGRYTEHVPKWHFGAKIA